MSSLGFQTVYRMLQRAARTSAPSGPSCPTTSRRARDAREPLRTYESARPVGDFPVVAFSLAYELELAGLVDCLDLAGIPAFAEERAASRRQRRPLIVIGGPLTFSNPIPAAPYADVMLHGRGRGDAAASWSTRCATSPTARRCSPAWPRAPASTCRRSTATRLPAIAAAKDDNLPAYSQIRTPHTELSRHVPDRARARLPPRLHLLRDAAVDQRRHAPGRARAR